MTDVLAAFERELAADESGAASARARRPPALWTLIEERLAPPERDEVRSILGSEVIERNLGLHAEVVLLDNIATEVSGGAATLATRAPGGGDSASHVAATSAAATLSRRELLAADIAFFVGNLRDYASRGGREATDALLRIATTSSSDRRVIAFACESGGAAAATAARSCGDDKRPPSARASRPGTAATSASGGTASSSTTMTAHGDVLERDEVSANLNAYNVDRVVHLLRAAFDDEQAHLLAEIDYLQATVDAASKRSSAATVRRGERRTGGGGLFGGGAAGGAAGNAPAPSLTEMRLCENKLHALWLDIEQQQDGGGLRGMGGVRRDGSLAADESDDARFFTCGAPAAPVVTAAANADAGLAPPEPNTFAPGRSVVGAAVVLVAALCLRQWPYASLMASSGGDDEVAVTAPTDVFVLAGQSNMAGRGVIAGDEGAADGRSAEGYLCDGGGGTGGAVASIVRLSATGAWVRAREPMHADIDTKKQCGAGPGLFFARHVAGCLGDGVIGLVPCAVGGTALAEWMPPNGGQAAGIEDDAPLHYFDEAGNPTTTGGLYATLRRRIGAALQPAGGARPPRLRAVLWYQGESDATDARTGGAYGPAFISMMQRLRADVNADLGGGDVEPWSLAVPLIVVIVSGGGEDGTSGGRCPHMEVVRAQQRALVVRSEMPVMTVDSAPLAEFNEDLLHLSTSAQRRLGLALAQAWRQTAK